MASTTTTSTPPQALLAGLTPREAVIDALHRCILGMDSNDRALFESGCLMTDEMRLVAGPFAMEGWTQVSGFVERVFALVTTHITSNIRVHVIDETTASLTAHAIATHVRPHEALVPEDTSYTAGNLYTLDLVRDAKDGLWKIKTWNINVLWTTGDSAVVHPELTKDHS